jgi:hypothetical protein
VGNDDKWRSVAAATLGQKEQDPVPLIPEFANIYQLSVTVYWSVTRLPQEIPGYVDDME